MVEFCGQLPRQRKSGDEAVNGDILCDAALCVDDLEYQLTLWLSQHLTKCSMAFIIFPLLH